MITGKLFGRHYDIGITLTFCAASWRQRSFDGATPFAGLNTCVFNKPDDRYVVEGGNHNNYKGSQTFIRWCPGNCLFYVGFWSGKLMTKSTPDSEITKFEARS